MTESFLSEVSGKISLVLHDAILRDYLGSLDFVEICMYVLASGFSV